MRGPTIPECTKNDKQITMALTALTGRRRYTDDVMGYRTFSFPGTTRHSIEPALTLHHTRLAHVCIPINATHTHDSHIRLSFCPARLPSMPLLYSSALLWRALCLALRRPGDMCCASDTHRRALVACRRVHHSHALPFMGRRWWPLPFRLCSFARCR